MNLLYPNTTIALDNIPGPLTKLLKIAFHGKSYSFETDFG